MRHSPKLTVWECFAYAGRGGLHFLSKGQMMNAQLYKTILKDKLPTWMAQKGCNVFQHDSARAQKAKSVSQWFQETGIPVLDWPSYSPDLSPVENLWGIVKQRLSKLQILSLPHLRQEITRIWCTEVTQEVCQNLISSMPRRISAVLKNNGHATKY